MGSDRSSECSDDRVDILDCVPDESDFVSDDSDYDPNEIQIATINSLDPALTSLTTTESTTITTTN